MNTCYMPLHLCTDEHPNSVFLSARLESGANKKAWRRYNLSMRFCRNLCHHFHVNYSPVMKVPSLPTYIHCFHLSSLPLRKKKRKKFKKHLTYLI